jgi:hypothetical protein
MGHEITRNDQTLRLKHSRMMVAITLNVATRRRLALVFGNITAVPENVGQANGRSDSHGGTIEQWVALALMVEVANVLTSNYHYVYDYGSGGRLGILLICWIFDWNVQCMGIENNSTRYANGLGFKELLEQLARESHAMSTTPIILYEGDFTRRDDRYVVRQRRRALVYVNNYDNCMLSIKGDLEEALSHNLTTGSVVVCFSRLFRPYDGRWTEERFEATITADGLSWKSGGEEDEIKIPVYKYTRTERPAHERPGPVEGRRDGRTCHTDVVEEIDLTGYRHYL